MKVWSDRADFLVALLTSFLVGGFALTNQSLWIDEAHSALKAMEPSLASWWHLSANERGSDLQMPLYMFYLWSWEKMTGHSEFALRLANLPWLVVAQFSLCRAARRFNASPIPLLVLASVSPFIWAYLNEARPYAMQYAAACLVIGGLAEIFSPKHATTWPLCVGIILLAGSSMLGAAWSASACAALFFVYVRVNRRPNRPEVIAYSATLLLLCVLGSFYLWTLMKGARGSAAAATSILNILYVFYELLGFVGLGPGRLVLREKSIHAFDDFVLPLAVMAISLALVLVAATPLLFARNRRDKLIVGAIYGLPAALFVTAAGFVSHFRLLGRHFTPILPLFLVVLAIGLTSLWRTRWKLVALIVPLLWLASALSLRFGSRHLKDDYRAAAAEARRPLSLNQTVWWSADQAGAQYYQLPIGQRNPRFDLVVNPNAQDLQELPRPDMVILSKTDLYDSKHCLADFLARENYHLARTLPAFTVWQR